MKQKVKTTKPRIPIHSLLENKYLENQDWTQTYKINLHNNVITMKQLHIMKKYVTVSGIRL